MSRIENPRWIRYPEVSFKHQSIMLVNGVPLEIPDILPEVLEDVIQESTDAINERIEREYMWDRERDVNAARCAILIGRLSLIGSEEKVLSEHGLRRMESTNVHVDIHTLKTTYQEYWRQVGKTGYIPEVHTNLFSGADDSISGTWLGVRRPEL